MLPAGITRDVHGHRRRPDAPESQTAQLVGRSRNERLLDGIYNRQSRSLRDVERKRRERKLAFLLSEAKRRRSSQPAATPDIKRAETKASDVKQETPTDTSDASAPSAATAALRTDVVIANLLKHVSNSVKFPKVIRLSRQLLETSYSESDRGRFLHLFCAIALSSNVTSLPSDSRGDAVALGNLFTQALCKTNDVTLSEPDANLLEDSETRSAYLKEPIALTDWVAILQLSVVWNNLLFTDDTYQFHHALSRFSGAFDLLPSFSVYESSPHPMSLSMVVASLLTRNDKASSSANAQRHPNSPNLSQCIPDAAAELQSSAPSSCASSESSFMQAGTAPFSGDVSTPKNLNDHSTPSDNDAEDEDQQWLPSRCVAYQVQRQLIMNSLPTLFQFSKTRWARTAVCKFFQRLYLHRNAKFSSAEASRIESWQSDIRSAASESVAAPRLTTRVGESAHPVRDARDERVVTMHGAAIWSAKQTGL